MRRRRGRPSPACRTLDGPAREIVPYIDWTPFFHAWELKGVYPRILEHPEWGRRRASSSTHGRRLLDADRRTSGSLPRPRRLRLLPAPSAEGDDVVVFEDDARPKPSCARFHLLRQQRRGADGEPLLCACRLRRARATPAAATTLGAFAVTAGLGLDELVAALRGATTTTTSAILAKALADRLAEALRRAAPRARAPRVGLRPRRAPLPLDDLINERYRGHPPAPGYPACPDHTEKATLLRLLDAERAPGSA